MVPRIIKVAARPVTPMQPIWPSDVPILPGACALMLVRVAKPKCSESCDALVMCSGPLCPPTCFAPCECAPRTVGSVSRVPNGARPLAFHGFALVGGWFLLDWDLVFLVLDWESAGVQVGVSGL